MMSTTLYLKPPEMMSITKNHVLNEISRNYVEYIYPYPVILSEGLVKLVNGLSFDTTRSIYWQSQRATDTKLTGTY